MLDMVELESTPSRVTVVVGTVGFSIIFWARYNVSMSFVVLLLKNELKCLIRVSSSTLYVGTYVDRPFCTALLLSLLSLNVIRCNHQRQHKPLHTQWTCCVKHVQHDQLSLCTCEYHS